MGVCYCRYTISRSSVLDFNITAVLYSIFNITALLNHSICPSFYVVLFSSLISYVLRTM